MHTKLHIPQPKQGDYIIRPALLDGLDEGLQAKLTALTAPPGYGKTTLVSAWIRQRGCRAGWVSLDRHDNDLERFWRHMTAAIQTEYPNFGEQEQLPSPGTHLHIRFMDAFLEALEALPEPLVLVLDDYHIIELSEIHESIAYLLDYMPRHIHLYITSRTALPFPTARLQAKGEMVAVTTKQLRFGMEDGVRYFKECMGLELSGEDAAMFVRRTEGWVSGLHLAAISLKTSSDPSAFIRQFSGRQRGIARYLLEEVLERQPEPIRLFLLQTSILSRMNAPLCEAVTGAPNVEDMLASLEERHLFVASLDEHGEWYRYHHLFADFLAQQFRRTMPKRWAEAHAAAARWLEASGDPAAAIEHHLSREHYAGALALIEQQLSVLQAHRAALRRWLDAIPDAALRTNPFVLLLHLKIKSESGDYHLVDRELRELAHRLDGREWEPWVGTYYFLGAETALYCRDFPRSYDYLSLYERHGRHDSDKLLMIAANTMTAVNYESILSFFDRLQDAEQYVATCIRIWEQKGNSPFLGYFYCFACELLIEWNRIDEAEAIVQRMLASGQWEPYALIRLMAVRLAARCRLIRGDATGAIAMLESFKSATVRLSDRDLFDRRIDVEIASISLGAGLTEQAAAWLDRCGLPHTDRIPTQYRDYLVMANVMSAAGRSQEACELLERIVRVTDEMNWQWDRIKVLIVYSMALDKQGTETEALDKLEEALALSEPQGLVQSWVMEGERLAPLLVKYLRVRRGGSAGYARRLLSMMNAQQDEERDDQSPLTPQETRILLLVDQGCKNREIASQLNVSDETVKKHLKNIFMKLQVSSRLLAVNRARELGMI